MNQEIYNKHHLNIPPSYIPDPERHLRGLRDIRHHQMTVRLIQEYKVYDYLDLGSFNFWLPLLIAERNTEVQVTGIEWLYAFVLSARKYAACKQLKNFTPIHGDVTEGIQIDNKFSMVSAYEILEHVRYEEVPAIIDDMEAHTSPGGICAVSLPDQGTENPQHQWLADKHTIADLFAHRNPIAIQEWGYPPAVKLPMNYFIYWKPLLK